MDGKIITLCCLILSGILSQVSGEKASLVIVIRSQADSFHAKKAEKLHKNLENQIRESNIDDIEVVLVHKELPREQDRFWAILPMFPKLSRTHAAGKNWVMFIEDSTEVNIKGLLEFLSRHDPQKELFLARGLNDNDMTIIHHFSSPKSVNGKRFLFPDFEVGWVLSAPLFKKILDKFGKRDTKTDFQIDLKHELAKYIKELGVELTHSKEFCGAGEEKAYCVTNTKKDLEECGNAIGQDDIFVAVKTTLMFHKDRIKAVKETWGPKWKNMVMYSNVTDPSIPTFDCGVPNTERGHCGKTDMILRDFLERSEDSGYKWLVIADDDTIMSVSRMIKFLNCFDPNESLFLGEKYGFSLLSDYGYGYITGGGGMVFSRPAAEVWAENCRCPTIDTPDDMFLGRCLLYDGGIVTTHSPLFHQARPDDYADGYLSNQTPISFHKHWMVDPIEVYQKWFAKADANLETFDHVAPKSHPTVAPTTVAPEMPSPLPPTPLESQVKDEL